MYVSGIHHFQEQPGSQGPSSHAMHGRNTKRLFFFFWTPLRELRGSRPPATADGHGPAGVPRLPGDSLAVSEHVSLQGDRQDRQLDGFPDRGQALAHRHQLSARSRPVRVTGTQGRGSEFSAHPKAKNHGRRAAAPGTIGRDPLARPHGDGLPRFRPSPLSQARCG